MIYKRKQIVSYSSIFITVKRIIVLFIFSFVFTIAVQAQEDQRAQFSLQPMDYSSLGFGLGFYPNGVYKIESSFGFIKSGILINAAYLGASSQRKERIILALFHGMITQETLKVTAKGKLD